jgi:hypothetical protein
MAAFGVPVVPAMCRSVPELSASSQVNSVMPAGTVGRAGPVTTMWVTASPAASAAAAASANSLEHTTSRARESASSSPRSAAVSMVFTGTATIPARIAPRMPVASSSLSAMTNMTRSSRRTPRAANAAAACAARSRRSRYVRSAPSHRSATRSPSPASTLRSTRYSAALKAFGSAGSGTVHSSSAHVPPQAQHVPVGATRAQVLRT